MTEPLYAAISSDIDTLQSIYKGAGCRRAEGYSYEELTIGLENFSRFLDAYSIKSTLFIVGEDLTRQQGIADIKQMLDAGHEIANHTLTHAQGFRLLSPQEKEKELAGMEELAEATLGVRPVGFRSPGWNISDDAFEILQRRAYLYDSSVFPTSLMPLLKFLHWKTMFGRSEADRTTMGQLDYLLASIQPYRTKEGHFGKVGKSDFVEFPLSVMPVLRLPFFATFLVSTGMPLFRLIYKSLRRWNYSIQFMFHLSDFVDYNTPSLSEQRPALNAGQYVPKALTMPLSEKLSLFHEAIETIAKDYAFIRLQDWALKLREQD